MEFIVLASFMLLVVLGFFAVISSRVLEAKEEGNRKIAEDIAEFAYHEIDIARTVNDGYIRTFVIPLTVNGISYIINVTDDRELVVNYLGYEHVKFLPSNVTGNISIGLNEIRKINGIVHLNSLQSFVECDDNIDNDGDTFIDLNDAGCTDRLDADETNCGDSVCEGSEGCLFCSSDCGICPPLQLLLMRGSLSNTISFYANGNAILKGVLQQGVAPVETADDEFIYRNANGAGVAIINLVTGNMFITGSLFQNQTTLAPSGLSNDFIIKAPDGNVISYIDDSGNFFLNGMLTQNTIP